MDPDDEAYVVRDATEQAWRDALGQFDLRRTITDAIYNAITDYLQRHGMER